MRVVLDASAIVAVLRNEPGSDTVIPHLDDAIISTVNVAEVYAHAALHELPEFLVDEFLLHRGIEIVPLSLEQSQTAGTMAGLTRSAGLSLGDRSCLSVAKEYNATALTADRAWLPFAEPLGLTIKSIR
jgi:ribonuclease VapC